MSVFQCLFIFYYFLIPRLQAAPSLESIPEATPFYRNQRSSFSSGHANSKNLENTFLRSEAEHSYDVLWDQKSYWLPATEILLEMRLAEKVVTLDRTLLRKEPKSTSRTLLQLKANTPLKIIENQDDWIQVQVPKTEIIGWITASELRSETFHTGKMISLIDTYLKKEPLAESKIITTFPRLKELIPLEFINDWVRVSYQGLTGYVPLQNFALRADFCNWAYDKNKKSWLAIKYRQGRFLITNEDKKIPLVDFIGFYPNPHLAISISTQDQFPPLRSHLLITKVNQFIWNISYLKGHGDVWWKPKNRDSEAKAALSQMKIDALTDLTTDQLFKKKIFSYAFNESASIKGVVSSSGIYITKDGLIWKRITDFKFENHPVSISKQGILYVGSYRSLDQGNSFQNYIRWDKITGLIQSQIKKIPRTLRLEEIQSFQKQNVELLLNTGTQKIRISGNSQHNTWSLIK